MVRSTLTCAFTLALCFASAAAGATQEPAGELPPATAEAPAPLPASDPPPAQAPVPVPPDALVITPLDAPPPATEAPQAPPTAPSPDAARSKKPPTLAQRCQESGTPRGILKAGLPLWSAGAVAGAAVGALTLAAAGILVAATLNVATLRGAPGLPFQASAILIFPAVGVLVGGLGGGITGALVAPFLPRVGLNAPCTQVEGGDPTLRRSGS